MSSVTTPDPPASTPRPTTSAVQAQPAAADAVTEYRFTALDRCDSCGAQAYVGATVNGIELLFCAHHGRKYESKLRAVATTWHDESIRLFEEQTRVGISA